MNRMRLISLSVKRPSVLDTSTAHSGPPARGRHYGSGDACIATAQIFWVPPLLSCGKFFHVRNIIRLSSAVFSF
eukprot:1892777-Pyramimonas_sp.AAC.1